MLIERLAWADAQKSSDCIFLAPLGSIEQHGPHLPLLTDTAIVSEIGRRVEKRDPDRIMLLPTSWLGHSPHHRRFACVSLDLEPYVQMICGVCRSLVALGAKKILLLNGHGGNDIPCKAALRELKSELENRPEIYIAYATYWNLAAARFSAIRTSSRGGMGHAGEMETSIMQVIHPDLVQMERASADGPYDKGAFRVADLLGAQPYHLVNEFDEISRTGTIGMPEHASREKGERFLESAVDVASAFIDEFRTWRYQEAAAAERARKIGSSRRSRSATPQRSR
ncbi:MAG: creatininase family protein [Terriglobia bacterium]